MTKMVPVPAPGAGGSVTVSSSVYEKRVDDAGSGVTYVGEADPGALPSSAVWRIFRMTEVTGDITTEYADGNSNFDNVWDNRASLSY